MKNADRKLLLRELCMVYEEFLPLLKSASHVEVVQSGLSALRVVVKAEQDDQFNSQHYNNAMIDYFNTIIDKANAAAFILKMYPEYKSRYPDTRLPLEGYLEVPLTLPQQAQPPGKLISLFDGKWHNIKQPSEIIYLEAQSNYTKVFSANALGVVVLAGLLGSYLRGR